MMPRTAWPALRGAIYAFFIQTISCNGEIYHSSAADGVFTANYNYRCGLLRLEAAPPSWKKTAFQSQRVSSLTGWPSSNENAEATDSIRAVFFM
jgi:hypothetical protein